MHIDNEFTTVSRFTVQNRAVHIVKCLSDNELMAIICTGKESNAPLVLSGSSLLEIAVKVLEAQEQLAAEAANEGLEVLQHLLDIVLAFRQTEDAGTRLSLANAIRRYVRSSKQLQASPIISKHAEFLLEYPNPAEDLTTQRVTDELISAVRGEMRLLKMHISVM